MSHYVTGTLQCQQLKYSPVEGKTHNLKWCLSLKNRSSRIAVLAAYIIHFWLVFQYPFAEKIFKFCKLELCVSGTFCLYFDQPSLKLERPALKIHILWCRTDICTWKLSAKVSSMLDNPFPVLFLCKLKHTSIYFIPKSIRITCK